jgi:two-component system response regulator NreC
MITLLLAEDAPIIRTALRSMFDNMEGISVIGDSPVSQLVEAVRKLRPNVIVISSVSPQPWHLPLIKEVSERPKRSAVMYLSRFKHASFVHEFFEDGGAACILDRASVETLSTAIRRVAAGRYYVDPDVSDEIVLALVGDNGRPRRVLSRREEGVLRLIASGHTHKEIARTMRISPTTVQTYINRIRRKVDLKERSDLVRYALTRGILTDTMEGEQ